MLIAEQPQALPAKAQKCKPPCEALGACQFHESEAGIGDTSLLHSTQQERAPCSAWEEEVCPACGLLARRASHSQSQPHTFRRCSTYLSFFREIRLEESGTPGRAGRRAAGVMWGEVATPLSPDRMSLSNIHVGLSALLHKYFPDKGLFANTVKAGLKESS